MEKINIGKKDSVPFIVEKILDSEEKEIVLSISSNSGLKKSLSNLELIKREAESAGKSISISSSDDEIIEMAEKADIPTNGSSSDKEKGQRVMSDIIPLSRDENAESETEKIFAAKPVKTESPEHGESFWEKAEKESSVRKQLIEEIPEQPLEIETKKPGRSRWKMMAISLSAVLIVALGIGWAVGAFWGRAEVSLNFKKTPWQYTGTIVAGKTFSQIDAAKNYLPAEIFKQNKNATRLFPGSGTSKVSQKATAKILIYNSYSSSKQTLVATTRFMSPDGKVFRLDNQVVVPGAGIKDGKIVPSSIEATVTAYEPGADYNVGPFEKMTLPGFEGTPRYEGFYGAMLQKAAGGFVGEKKVATATDITSAKDKTSQGLKDALQSGFFDSKPDGFDILDGASSISITKLNANSATDESGNFSVFGEASMQAIGFRGNDLKSLLDSLVEKDNQGMSLGDLKVDYKNIKANFIAGQLTFSIDASGILGPKFSDSELKPKIAGKNVNDARALVVELPELAGAKISLWPFWLNKLPKDEDKIKVTWN